MVDGTETASEIGPEGTSADVSPKLWESNTYPTAADYPSGGCRIGKASRLEADVSNPGWDWVVKNCDFEQGVRVVFREDVEEPDEVEGLAPPVLRLPRIPHAPRKLPTKVALPKEKPSMLPQIVLATPTPELDEGAAEGPVAAPTTTASVGVPDNALADIQKLIPADGNASVITVLLAVVGVAGGGAAFKFYRSWQKGRHEQEMKRLEIEEKKAERSDDQHQQCNAARTALEAKVSALESKLDSALAGLEQKVSEAKPAGPFVDLGDFDPEELEDRLKKDEARLKKLEQALKPTPKGRR